MLVVEVEGHADRGLVTDRRGLVEQTRNTAPRQRKVDGDANWIIGDRVERWVTGVQDVVGGSRLRDATVHGGPEPQRATEAIVDDCSMRERFSGCPAGGTTVGDGDESRSDGPMISTWRRSTSCNI